MRNSAARWRSGDGRTLRGDAVRSFGAARACTVGRYGAIPKGSDTGQVRGSPRRVAVTPNGDKPFREAGFVLYRTASLGELAESLGSIGRVAPALTAIDEALVQSRLNDEHWCIPELLRIKGELLVLEASPNAATRAEEHFSQSLDLARQQEALSWQLRTAISLFRLQRDQNRPKEARKLLAPIYGRFTEGFRTTDLETAKRLLSELN